MENTQMTWWEYIFGTVKRYWYRYVIISLLLSLVAGIWFEWREEQDRAVARLEADYTLVLTQQKEWLNASSAVISEAARPNARYPTRQSLMPLYEDVRNTLDAMTTVYAPTDALAVSAKKYRDALQDIAGSINQYEPNDKSMSQLLSALQTAANYGGEFQSDVQRYLTDAWRSFISVIL